LFLLLLPPSLPFSPPAAPPRPTALPALQDPITAARLSFISTALLSNQTPSSSTVLALDCVSPSFCYALPKSTRAILGHPTFLAEVGGGGRPRVPFRTRRQMKQALERRLIAETVALRFAEPEKQGDVALGGVKDASVDVVLWDQVVAGAENYYREAGGVADDSWFPELVAAVGRVLKPGGVCLFLEKTEVGLPGAKGGDRNFVLALEALRSNYTCVPA
jgi:hypothetical protein